MNVPIEYKRLKSIKNEGWLLKELHVTVPVYFCVQFLCVLLDYIYGCIYSPICLFGSDSQCVCVCVSEKLWACCSVVVGLHLLDQISMIMRSCVSLCVRSLAVCQNMTV